jgi:hypothetical protein
MACLAASMTDANWSVDRTPLALADVNKFIEQNLILSVQLHILLFNSYVFYAYRFA